MASIVCMPCGHAASDSETGGRFYPLTIGQSFVMVQEEGQHAPSFEVDLPRLASSPSLARRRTTSFLGDHQREDLFSPAAIVVSELVTNAVLHGAEPIRLAVAIDALLRIEVFDGDHRADQVAPRPAAANLLGNRGLQIVNTLAHTWGASPHPAGKVVWAELRLPD